MKLARTTLRVELAVAGVVRIEPSLCLAQNALARIRSTLHAVTITPAPKTKSKRFQTDVAEGHGIVVARETEMTARAVLARMSGVGHEFFHGQLRSSGQGPSWP